jgi:hypothetical protein
MQVASIDATGDKGPFLVYFQLDYDMRQEGAWAVVLSSYDKDANTFKEIGLFTLQENQATVIQVVEKG